MTTTWTTTYTEADETKAKAKITAIKTAWSGKTADIKSSFSDAGTNWSSIW